MKAIAVKQLGATPEQVEIAKPSLQPGQILVKMAAAGLNPVDWRIADGMLEGKLPHVFPLVIGTDGAGVIEAVADDVTGFSVNERVAGKFMFGIVGAGSYAEYAAIDQRAVLAKVPDEVSLTKAAAMPIAAGTALKLVEKLQLPAGATLLVVGATGGVGRFVIQLAKRQGLKVIATGGADAEAALRELGAEKVIDHHRAPVLQQVQQQYPQGIDGMIDLVSNAEAFSALLVILRKGGVALSTIWSAVPEQMQQQGLRGGNLEAQISADELEQLLQSVARGELQVPVERLVSIKQAPEMLAQSKAGGSRGKTVLNIDW
ncbi:MULTISPECIES: NADP-dependent oxidoreductase [Serratia]|uniref:NADP-dependent oxidoreductase n=1 Tax=Serratia TaxID=613 RepID=UPI000BFF90A5|nr:MULTISPECIES: NADP-dependent oxidoreductase [Serratia]CAI1604481.1 Alcohol dehydrogenase [Serratia proteamaculans]HCV65275.1 NADP-dependent oxidoreductase [Serratia sp. (in: enterobacteria)]